MTNFIKLLFLNCSIFKMSYLFKQIYVNYLFFVSIDPLIISNKLYLSHNSLEFPFQLQFGEIL